MITQATQFINGSGKPRLLVNSDNAYASVPANSSYTATTATESGGVSLLAVRANMRISSMYDPGGGWPLKQCYARVVSVNDSTDTITVDAWYPATPSNGQGFNVDGFVVDLPYCQELTETFEPDYLTHELYRGDEGIEVTTKFRGWKYTCSLDYGRYMGAGEYLKLRPALQTTTNKGMILIPRADQPRFNYVVYFDETVELSRFGLAPGYRKSVFVFRSVRNLPSWPLIDGYGTGYGENYGTQL